MIRIYLFYKEGTKDGKKFKVPHTIDFGYDVSVLLAGNSIRNVRFDSQKNADYIDYDPSKAGMKVLPNGYLQLVIGA